MKSCVKSTDYYDLFSMSLHELGEIADKIRKEKCGELVTFVVDTNINYTNVCVSKCKFCAFYARDESEAFVLSEKDILRKVAKAVEFGATQILMQGGLNPELDLAWFEKIFSSIKEKFPSVHIHSLSPPEIIFLAKLEGLNFEEVLLRLKKAGLDSLPGGGAEILSDRVRTMLSKKGKSDEWLEVMRTAHELGIPTTATMMFGHVEKEEEIIEHLLKIRELQEETGGFTAFIPWTFQPGRSELKVEKASPVKYLKVVAISRIVLDNFRNIQASWLSQGFDVASLSLHFGANDFGGTLLEEKVISSTGKKHTPARVEQIVKAIRKAGRIPARRDTYYNIFEVYA